MNWISSYVLLPLTFLVLLAAFSNRLCSGLRRISVIAALEKKLEHAGKYYWVGFVLCMLFGVFARCYRFVELPLGINQDGLMAGTEAISLLMNGTDQYGMSWPAYFEAWGFSQMSTLYSYLLIPFFAILGISKFTLRLPMLLVSIAMLLVMWDFARRIAGKGFALAVLFVAATNPWHIIQSRWALEANLMPHVLLMGVYLLYIGRQKRWALFLSMVFFGLAPYAYGVACFSVPVFLVLAAAYYLARRHVKIWELAVCVLIFVAIGGPYFYTMAINAFGLETVHIGPFTLPHFEKSLRSQDMAFTQENPYYLLVKNLFDHLGVWLFRGGDVPHNVISWAGALYGFMSPVVLYGVYSMWQDRREMALRAQKYPMRDGAMIALLWLAAALFNGAMIGGVVNRNNALYYPLILFGAYALYQMGKRLRTGLAVMILMLLVSFAGLNWTYFTDNAYQREVGDYNSSGQYEALVDAWDMDYDKFYIVTLKTDAHTRFMQASAMFAHGIDYSARIGERELTGPDGKPTGRYFDEMYVFSDFVDTPPDPMEHAVYVVPRGYLHLFDPELYEITEYDNFAIVYPRYWLK